MLNSTTTSCEQKEKCTVSDYKQVMTTWKKAFNQQIATVCLPAFHVCKWYHLKWLLKAFPTQDLYTSFAMVQFGHTMHFPVLHWTLFHGVQRFEPELLFKCWRPNDKAMVAANAWVTTNQVSPRNHVTATSTSRVVGGVLAPAAPGGGEINSSTTAAAKQLGVLVQQNKHYLPLHDDERFYPQKYQM
ncbi:unnamed protein product [Amoebophrya sp. A120]|nr:unnamed protein product [Amoebophrya sp. A120]|eukprot:GSA120T00009372001.1